MRKFGTQMALEESGGTSTPFTGFLQPLRYKNKMYLGEVTTPLGFDNSRKFLLLTSSETDVSRADGYEAAVTLGGKRFSCDHRELEYFKNEPVYAWAIVTLIGEEDEDADE